MKDGVKRVPRQKIIESGVVSGMLDGFIWGDYLHSEFINKNGEKIGF